MVEHAKKIARMRKRHGNCSIVIGDSDSRQRQVRM